MALHHASSTLPDSQQSQGESDFGLRQRGYASPPMEIRILGGLEVVANGEPVQIGGSQRQTLLALLTVDPGRPVTTDRLISDLWAGTAPEGARRTVQAHMSHLRRAMNTNVETLAAAERGYRLVIEHVDLDAALFETKLESARRLADREPRRAVGLFEDALSLVHGPPFAGLTDDVPTLAIEAARLSEMHLAGTESMFDARLAAGEDSTLVADLNKLVALHPLRERMWGLLMTSLYRAGRQADALRSFNQARHVLAEELGIEPSPELRDLEQRILEHDARLMSGPVGFNKGVPESSRNPYKGLRRFDESDASDFFGREDLVRRLLEYIDSRNSRQLLILAGPSGSGKSSVVRAGLIPELRRAGHEVAVAYPGRDPWASVANAIVADTGVDLASARIRLEDDATSGGKPLVVVLDQSEELFTLVSDPDRNERFLSRLGSEAGSILWILTLRADSLDQMMSSPSLGQHVADSVILVPPLQDYEVAAAVARPAQQVGVTVDPDLVAKIVAEVKSRPTALPLLQFSLTDIFDRRKTDRLGVSDFESAGGLSGALVKRADHAYEGLSEVEREAIRQVFLQLVTVTDEGIAVGRRLKRAEVEGLSVDPGAVGRVIDRFVEQRLITVDQDPDTGLGRVELSHEALIGEWPLLSGWVESSKDDLRLRKRLAAAVDEWDMADRDQSFSLRGNHLIEFENWSAESRTPLDAGARLLLSESRHLEDTERRRRRSRRRLVVGGLSIAVVAAALSAIVAFAQRERAEDAAAIAAVRELAAASEANVTVDPQLSLLLALEAVRKGGNQDVPEALNALHRSLIADRLLARVEFDGQGVARFSPEGDKFLTSGDDPSVPVVYDFETMTPLFRLEGHSDQVIDGVFSPDGKLLATASLDGTVRMWDAKTGAPVTTFETDLPMSMPGFSRDSTMLAAASFDGGTVRVWNVESGELLQVLEPSQDAAATFNPEFSPDGKMLAAGARPPAETIGQIASREAGTFGAMVWDLSSGELTVVGEGHSSIRDVNFTPDGAQLLTSGFDGTVRIWDIATWENIRTFYGHNSAVLDIDISDDGTLVASTANNEALVWELETGDVLQSLVGQSGPIDGVDLSPDGRRLLTAAGDHGTLMVWDVTSTGGHELFGFPVPDTTGDVAFSPDGSLMAAVRDAFGGIDLWSFPAGELIGTMQVPTTNITSISFSSDGAMLALGGDDGTWLADLSTFRVSLFDDRDEAVAAFGPGRMLAYGNDEGIGISYDYRSAPREEFPFGYTYAVAVHPEGRFVAGSIWDRGWGILDLETGLPTILTSVTGIPVAVDFKPDGSWFATLDWFSATVWDTATLSIVETFEGPSGEFTDVDIHPTQAQLATASDDGTVRIWDIDSGVIRLTLESGAYAKLSYSPDGRYLAVSGSKRGNVFILDTAELVELGEQRLIRWWTEAECAQYLHDPICPEVPTAAAQISR